MKLHRFLVDFSLSSTLGEIRNRELIHQIEAVLRLKQGSQVILFNKEGEQARVELDGFSRKAITFAVLSTEKAAIPSVRKVVLAAAIVKHHNFEWVVQKATEIGVVEIVPLITHHSVKLGLQMKRLQKIMVEATEQSGQINVPVLSESKYFKDVLMENKDKEKVFFDFSDQQFSGNELEKDKEVIIFVGPEGGWSDEENKLAKEQGCFIRSLGQTVLRTETAAVVASYLVVNS